MSVNKVILLGNVGREPDVRYIAQGQAMATISLATTERAYTNAQGTTVPERTEWHTVVMWNRNAEFAERYIHKGAQLYIEGRLRTRMWEDRNQIKHYITEVHADHFELVGRPRADQPAAARPQATRQQPAQQPTVPQNPQQQSAVRPQQSQSPQQPQAAQQPTAERQPWQQQ